MKNISDFSKGERVIAVISAIWLVIIFASAFAFSDGNFDDELIGIFFIFGLVPVLVVIGWKWIQGASAKKTKN